MPQRSIHVLFEGEKDESRWLTILPGGEGEALVRLNDMVHPGMQSSLKSFKCPLFVLSDVLKDGFVQIRLAEGYCQFRSRGDAVEVCFEGLGDDRATECVVSKSEFAELVGSCDRATAGTGN
jgi:hypothetical protein